MSERLLFINACIRGEKSRTYKLCKKFMQKMKENCPDLQTTELDLYQCNLKPLSEKGLLQRELCQSKRSYDHPDYIYAKLFAKADYILIGAPYWDCSFPSVLKIFIENISVNGITFYYDEEGNAHGLCNGKDLVYITTAGGYIGDLNCGYNYICGINNLYKIPNTHFASCEGLDIWGRDTTELIKDAEKKVCEIADDILPQQKV